jgi:hypothetical protein
LWVALQGDRAVDMPALLATTLYRETTPVALNDSSSE